MGKGEQGQLGRDQPIRHTDRDKWALGEKWEEDLNGLIDSGKTLDRPTKDPYFRREVFGGADDWRMPEGDAWIERRLKIRTKLGEVKLMRLNRAQLRYSYDCAEKQAKRNIVLKARQVGMTSYIAGRFFVQTITRPGTLTMLVAHDRVAAEEIFRIVQPGRMAEAERRVAELEKHEIRRNVYDRMVSAAVAMIISAAIAMHDRWLK